MAAEYRFAMPLFIVVNGPSKKLNFRRDNPAEYFGRHVGQISWKHEVKAGDD